MFFPRCNADVTELKSWSRYVRRAENRTLRGRLRCVRESARSPVLFWRSAWTTLGEYGSAVRSDHGVSLFRQLTYLAWYRLRFGLDPISYYRFQLYRSERRGRASEFVQTSDVGRVLRWLVRSTPGYPAVFRDKRVFDRWCREHGLPSIPTLAEFEDGRLVRASEVRLPRCDLFSKPSNGQCGQGAKRWTFDGTDRWHDSPPYSYTDLGLLDHLARQSSELRRPILLQRLLVNHRSLRPLAPGRLCTARIVTGRQIERPSEVLQGVYRMPVGSTVADNFALGGIAAPIDLATGRLGSGIRKYPRVQAPIDTHPDSGLAIVGIQLPYWTEACHLVRRAHDSISWKGVPVVGWDVALLDEGPVLLEGNNIPCSTFAQMLSGEPLGRTRFVACINAHLRENRSCEKAAPSRAPENAWNPIA
jgi:hypothetical protein